MAFRVYHHADPNAHPARPGHSERPHRVAAVLDGLATVSRNFPRGMIEFKAAPVAPVEAALLLHDAGYIEELARPFGPHEEFRRLDTSGRTIQAADSFEAALGAVGAACEAVDDAAAGKIYGALIACRPAGHQALRAKAQDGCILGTAALAAKHARKAHGMRVAVLDFDAHFGSGTVSLLGDDPDIFYGSTYQETDRSNASDTARSLSIPLPSRSRSGSFDMREAWAKITQRVREFAPDLIVVSAGFDAHEKDCSSSLRWIQDDYRILGYNIETLARDVCGGRVIHVLEGGDDLEVLRYSSVAYLQAFYRAPLPDNGMAADAYTEPQFSVGNASPYLESSFKAGHLYSGGLSAFSVVGVGGRLWICRNGSNAMIYTVPDALRRRSWRHLDDIAERVTGQFFVEIRDIIELEARARRVSNRPRRRGRFLHEIRGS